MRFRTLVSLLVLAPAATACLDERNAPLSPTTESAASIVRTDTERCAMSASDAEVRAELEALLAEVGKLEASGALNAGQARALTNHLRNALADLERGQHCPARAQLEAFRRQLESFVRSRALEAAQARPLIRTVNDLLNDRVELRVDGAAAPVAPSIAGLGGGAPRPLARFVNADGRAADFVENELYLMTDDGAALQSFLGRWNGSVLATLDFRSVGVSGTPPVHLVRVDASRASTNGLAERWARSAGLSGENVVSSEAALRLLAAALEETVERGLTVGVNFLLESADFAERTTTDAASAVSGAGYTPNAFAWPYMSRGSAQDIGTAEAWRVLDAMGRFTNRVHIGVADGGFRPNADFPAARRIVPTGGLRIPNPDPGNCGSSGPPTPTCVWHGTHVVMAGMARADNAFGAAGPASPVADLVMLQSPSADFFAVMDYILTSVPSALSTGPRIINISASTSLPTELCLLAIVGLPVCEALHAVAAGFRAAGILVVAAAGNQGRDVDETKRFGIWPFEFTEEAELTIPCELTTVLCVGGLDWDATRKHPNSNWGSNTGSPNTVRMFGPFDVWSVADAVAADEASAAPDARAGLISGTSFATPYVAGVAALVWAANPALGAGGVESILLSTAHTASGDRRVPRWVNALAAVQRAVGGDTPPWIRIVGPADGSRHPRGRVMVELAADVEDLEGDAITVRWESSQDGFLGTGAILRRNDLSFGAHRITATATARGLSASDAIDIDIFNEPPTVEIVAPSLFDPFCVGQPVAFSANVTDLNNPPSFTLPDGSISWHIGTGGPAFATGREATRAFDAPGDYRFEVRAVDDGGLSALRWSRLIIRDCAGLPPTALILEPDRDIPLNDPAGVFDGFDAASGLWYKDVRLRGSASDPEDGALTGASLVWSREVTSGTWSTLGTGGDLTVRLFSESCFGQEHTIRLVATDSDGNPSAPALRRITIWTLC
jgi:serine protease